MFEPGETENNKRRRHAEGERKRKDNIKIGIRLINDLLPPDYHKVKEVGEKDYIYYVIKNDCLYWAHRVYG